MDAAWKINYAEAGFASANEGRDLTSSSTPAVLLIAWRRPETTAQVMAAISSARPSRFFVAIDGPDENLRPGETAKVQATIDQIERLIDWPCRVERQYSVNNLGCRASVTSAIDWFFQNVDEGIILEDDCVPHPEFFPYCGELLERFRHSTQVMCISGDNSARVATPGPASYSFIRYPQIWGWATWRRAWDRYDRDLMSYQQARADGTWRRAVPHAFERETFERVLDRIVECGEPDTWDYQWAATLLLERGLSVHPAINLITNVGFGESATHTTVRSDPRAAVATAPIFPVQHRTAVRLNKRTSRAVFLSTQVSQQEAAKSRARRLVRRALSAARSIMRRSLRNLKIAR
jgi:hypothetical protein